GRDVAPPLGSGELPLLGRSASAHEQRLETQCPSRRQLARECLRRMVASRKPTVAVGRDEREAVDAWTLDGVDDDRRRPGGEPAKPALLPGADDPPHRRVVLHRGTRAGKREPATCAFDAATDGPGRWRAAARARGRG